MCGRPQKSRPSRSRHSRPAAPPGSRCRSIHSAPGTAAAPRSCRGREGSSGAERPARATTRAQSPGHAAIPARLPADEQNLPRPAPVPRQTRSPQPRPLPGSRQASPASAPPPGSPGCPAFTGGRKSPRRPLLSARLPRRRGQTLLRDASGLSEAAEGSRWPRSPARWREESRAGGPKPAWAVTLMILRGSPAILSDPEFGLCSCLRLRSPHARVEVPGSTSGERRRARRRCLRGGPSGNVVPARTRASHGLPSDLAAPSPALPAPTPAGGGGSDAPRRGRDFGGGGARRCRAFSPAAESARLGVGVHER